MKGKWALRTTAIVIGIFWLPMIWVGAELALMGGTLYYLGAGILMTFSAVDLWRNERRGFFVFMAVLLLTLAWAVYEVGTNFWLVGSRIWLISIIALWLSIPGMRRGLWGDDMPKLFSMRIIQVCTVASVAVVLAMTFDLLSDNVPPIADTRYGPPQNSLEWEAYGGSHAGTRYVPHAQIDRTNVGKLTRVWQTDTGKTGRFSGTPIQIDDGLYLCTAQNVMLALDADTGVERWRFCLLYTSPSPRDS